MQDHWTRISERGVTRLARTVLAVGLGTLAGGAYARAAADAPADAPARKTVVAHDYPAGGFKRAMLGSGYREVWATPFSVEVLDLQKEAGGLKPVLRVGGQQTKGLALLGADGRGYTFRGLEKDASHLLDSVDPELKDSVIAKVLNDLMSAQHPASELVARGILDATGIPCPPWRLVTLPDDPALGKFQKDFAGAVGVFAEYPQAAKGTLPGFLGATEIVDHLELYRRLEAGEATADTRALLRARLVDIFMGDWDRHRKQWRWAKLPGNPLWTPIPEDRDQAFSRYEGFVLDRARGTDPRFQDFSAEYPKKIGGLTFNGAEQDRRLLVGFSREDFLSEAKALQAQLTDQVIEKAARQMPPEWYAIDGAWLVAALKVRRDTLAGVAAKYYEHLARGVDVYLTSQSERVEAKRLGNGDMDVTVRRLAADGTPGDATYHRVFREEETDEVRFYALAGNDTVKVTGGDKGPRVRMIGGKGNDTLDAAGAGNAKLSDSQGGNRAEGAQEDDKTYHPPPPPKNAPWIPPRDFTRETFGIPLVSYGADLGVYLGYAVQTQAYGFRKSPYANAHRFSAGWAFKQKGGRVDYRGDFRRENRGSHFGLYAFVSGVEVLRFYGFGNEIEAPEDQEFYKVDARQFVLFPSLKIPFAKHGLFTVGPALKYTENDQATNQFINSAQPYGAGDFGALAVHGVLSWDGRDSVVVPRRGVFAAVRGSYFFEGGDAESAFEQVNGNVNAYMSAGPLTLALRAGGKKVFGTYPYMEAAALGQGGLGAEALEEPHNTVRGYRARRYLGDASAYANGDLRLRISRINLIVPAVWGVTAFADVGRVWLEGEESDTWHTGVGGGIWMSFLANRMAFSFGLSHGKEEDLIYFVGGFGF